MRLFRVVVILKWSELPTAGVMEHAVTRDKSEIRVEVEEVTLVGSVTTWWRWKASMVDRMSWESGVSARRSMLKSHV